MKNDRQTILLEIIEQQAVETQEQLLRLLAERGVKCTQATVSRDIKQLHLVKEPTGHGRYRYAVSVQKTKLNFAEKLRTIFRECVLSVEAAQNLVVLKPCWKCSILRIAASSRRRTCGLSRASTP